MMTLTDSIVRENDWYRSSFETWSSRRARSTLLTMTTGLIRSVRACRSTVSVCTQTPSTQSTTTKAPSVTRRAAVTSDEKSTWPGESIRLIKNSFPSTFWGISLRSSSSVNVAYSEIAVDLIVIHRSCSSCRVSVNRASPAFAAEIIPARWTSESVRVDFPWSTIRAMPSASSHTAIALYLQMTYHGQ